MSSIFPIASPSGEEWVLISKTVVNVSTIEFGGVSRYVPFVNENTLTSGSMFSILFLYISFGSDEENMFNNDRLEIIS